MIKGSLIWDRVDHNLKIYNAEKKTGKLSNLQVF